MNIFRTMELSVMTSCDTEWEEELMCGKYTLILAFLGLFGTNSLADRSLCLGQNKAAKEKHVKACCVVTAVDPQAGKVSVREAATGCTFQFEVSQKSQIERFRPGQPVDKGQGAAST